jgi:hypothetical protein
MRNLCGGFPYHEAMPISHVCTGCGVDLAHLSSEPEPHYGLRVIVCPKCRSASVRTREPLIAGWRSARRLAAAGTLALLHIGVLGLLSVAFTGFAYAQSARWIDPSAKRLVNDPDAPLLTILAAIASLAGLWLGLTVTHRSVLARVGIWLGVLAIPISISAVIVKVTWPSRPTLTLSVEDHPIFLLGGFAIATGSGVLVALAELPAWMGRFLGRTATTALFKWRRGRARRRRSGQ